MNSLGFTPPPPCILLATRRNRRWNCTVAPALLVLFLSILGTPAVGSVVPAAQLPAPSAGELTREQQEHFLLHAKIGKTRGTKIGVTGSRRATLSDGKLTHDAHIQTVDVFRRKAKVGRKTEFNFRDYWGFNVAAYRLDKLLGLNIVPVTVDRWCRGERSAVAWWVDGVMMNGVEFRKLGFKAPVEVRMNDQRANARVFQRLIYNTDSNLGNEVIDQDWKRWIFDFTRAFRRWEKLQKPEVLHRIGRGLFNRLRELEVADVERELGPFLRPREMKALLARRDRLVQHFERLIGEKGEATVMIDGF